MRLGLFKTLLLLLLLLLVVIVVVVLAAVAAASTAVDVAVEGGKMASEPAHMSARPPLVKSGNPELLNPRAGLRFNAFKMLNKKRIVVMVPRG